MVLTGGSCDVPIVQQPKMYAYDQGLLVLALGVWRFWLMHPKKFFTRNSIARRAIGRSLSLNSRVTCSYLSIFYALASRGKISASLAEIFTALPTPRPLMLPLGMKTGHSYFTPGSTDELHGASRLRFLFWEAKSRALFAELAKQSTYVLDIGSYSGVYALSAAAANLEARVIAFEPNPRMCAQIRENIRLNGLSQRISLHEIALSNFDGFASLFLSEESSTAGIASVRFEPHLHPINANLGVGPITKAVCVKVRTIDSLGLPRVDLIKIDAEGSEPVIFEGAAQTIHRDQPVILAEALTPEDLLSQQRALSSLGYLPPIPVDPAGIGGDDCNYLWVSQLDFSRLEPSLANLGVIPA